MSGCLLFAIKLQQQIVTNLTSAVVAQADTQYLLVDATSEQPVKDLVLKKQGDDLVVEVDGEVVVTIQSFYTVANAEFNTGQVTNTGEAILITSASPIEEQTSIVWPVGEDDDGAGYWAAAALGAGALAVEGIVSIDSDSSSGTIDTTAPTASAITANDDVGSDTGSLSSGDSTDDTALELSGTNENGAAVEVFDGATSLGQATVSGTTWTYTATVVDGTTHQFTSKETDAAGNEGASSSNFEVTGVIAPIELSELEQDSDNRGFVINGVSTGDRSGRSVSSAGDVNGDGLADLIVGAYADDPNGDDSGASFVVFGKTDGTAVELSAIESGNGGFVINGVSAGDNSGFNVSSAGDVNGDGLADLIVGARRNDPNGDDSGASFVVFGKTDSTAVELSAIESGNGGFVINGVSADDYSGRSVSDAGDVNGDGLADLIVGTFGDDPNGSRSGASFVVFGKTDSTAVELSAIETGNGGFVINGVSAGDNSGFNVSSAGDVNGDGLADLIVGARRDDPNGDDSGASFVVFGKTDSTVVELSAIESGNGGFVINGVSAGDASGASVSSAGDVNGDGLADLIVGAYADDPNGNSSGASFVVFGKTDSTAVELSAIETGTDGFVINGVSGGDRSGLSVSSAGDVNGDGLADLIVGAYADDPNGNSSGVSFVVFGKTDSTAVELSAIETGNGGFVINGVSGRDASGLSVSSAGDVNGDGFADLIVGAYADDPNGGSSGASFVIFGGQGTSATVGTSGDDTLTGDATANQIVAGQGNDTLIGNGGADVLRGGAGNDILVISDLNFASLDGGTGIDTLRLDGSGIALDLTQIGNTRVSSIEKIDLTGSGNNSLVLTALEVNNLTGANTFETTGVNAGRKQLMVEGDAGDVLTFDDAGWGQGASVTLNSNSYNVFNNADSLTTVYVESAVTVANQTVVFDLVGGTSSDHSNRTFDADVDYTIYVRVDSDSAALLNDGNSAVGTWGEWSGAENLDSGDKLVMVGAGGAIQGPSNGSGITSVGTAGPSIQWLTAPSNTAGMLNNAGLLNRDKGGATATLDLWDGTVAPTQFVNAGFTAMPAGVLTSQGLA